MFGTLFSTLARVTAHSGRSPNLLLLGLALRFLERTLVFAPFVVAFLWLQSVWLEQPEHNAQHIWGLQPDSLTILIGALGISLLLQFLCAYLGQLCCFLGAYRLMHGYRERLLSKLTELPLFELQQQRTGSLAQVLTEDFKNVENIFTHISVECITALVVPCLLLLALAWLDWRLALSLLAVLPLGLFLLSRSRRWLLQRGLQQSALQQNLAGLLVEYARGLTTLKLFHATPRWRAKLNQQFRLLRNSSMQLETWGAGPVLLYRLCIEGGLVILLLTGAWLSFAQDLNPLHWLLFVLIGSKLTDTLLEAGTYLTLMGLIGQSEQRLQDLLTTPALIEPAKPAEPVPGDYSVIFDGVHFAYPDRNSDALTPPNEGATDWHLTDINVRIPSGSLTAVVGGSGAGKSTLAHLLARLFEPQRGCIRVAGRDIRALGSQKLCSLLGMVFQDVQLFNGSFLENVRIGKPGASDQEVIQACQQACCDSFIRRLPQGYHTLIGEDGHRLSGGERQRLSIARAFLKDAPILILDEATASVDPAAQYDIQQSLSRLAEGKTLLVVAHRLNTIRHADQIVVLDQGRAVETGQHQQLLEQRGYYWRLWRSSLSAET